MSMSHSFILIEESIRARCAPPPVVPRSPRQEAIEELLRAVATTKVKKRMQGYYRYDPQAGREVFVPEHEYMGALWDEPAPTPQEPTKPAPVAPRVKRKEKEDPLLSLFDQPDLPAPAAVAPSSKPISATLDEALLERLKGAPTAPPEKPVSRVAVRGEAATKRPTPSEITKPRVETVEEVAGALAGYGARGAAKAERVEQNRKAIELAKAITEAKRKPTDDERTILARYSGEGGSGDSLNEFYTSPEVALSLWGLMEQAGFKGGPVLEPSCGAGVFLRSAPAGAGMIGVELSPESAMVAGLLHPEAEVNTGSLEEFATTDGRRFAAVIGNPPFGERGRLRAADKIKIPKAENYFVDTALDLVEDGGLVGLVLPHGVVSGTNNRAFRESLHRKAEVVVAHRLPVAAFAHSHVDVTTDLLVLRKRPQPIANMLAEADYQTLEHLGLWEDHHQSFIGGTYFDDHPGQVHGEVTDGGNFGSLRVVGEMSPAVYKAIAEAKLAKPDKTLAVDDVLMAASGDPDQQARMSRAEGRQVYTHLNVGDTKVEDGITYMLNRNHRWERVDTIEGTDGANPTPGVLADAVDLRNRLARLAATRVSGDHFTFRLLQKETRGEIEKFLQTYGNPHESKEIQDNLDSQKLHSVLAAIGKNAELSDLLTRTPATALGKEVNKNDLEAVLRDLAERNTSFDEQAVLKSFAGELGQDELRDKLLHSEDWAINGEGNWEHRADWLTGDLYALRGGLDSQIVATSDYSTRAKLERQRLWLQEELAPKSLEDIEVSLRSGWVPLELMAEYLQQDENFGRGRQGDISIVLEKGVFHIYGLNPWNAKSLWKYMNRTAMSERDDLVIDGMEKGFKEWLSTSEHRDAMETRYNQMFQGWREKRYSGEPLKLDGMNPKIILHHFQAAAVRKLLEEGGGIMAHDVGLGKTFSGLALVMALKQSGKARKPMVVVPKSVLVNWVRETRTLFPDARMLVIGASEDPKTGKWTEDSRTVKDVKLHQAAQNDYDLILTTQPMFGSLDIAEERKQQYQDDDFWTQRKKGMEGASDKKKRKEKEAYEGKLAGREMEAKREAILFEDLGVDALLMDEMHAYKNLWSARSRGGGQPKFLGGSAESKRALDFLYKARYVRDLNEGRGIYGLTATPTKNSPLEIYSMLSYAAPQAFQNLGIRNSEEFIDRYCELENRLIVKPKRRIEGEEGDEAVEHDAANGELVEVPCVVGFKNLDEIRPILARYVQRRTAGDVGLEIPKPEVLQHVFKMDADQNLAYDELRAQLEKSQQTRDAKGEMHIFSILSRMEKATMDLELLGPEHVGHAVVAPKYVETAANVARIYQQGTNQLVFSDKNDSHQKLKRHFINAGIPEDEIAIISGDATPHAAERQRVAEAYNTGKYRVVIGNTATMGEGLNLQVGTSAIHHLDLPWEPSSLWQRNGRGVRQGNKLESVGVHYYLGEGSFDFYRHQLITGKQNWMDSLWSGGNHVENQAIHGQLSPDDILIMGSANPEAARAQLAANQTKREQEYIGRQRAKAIDAFASYQDMKRKLKLLNPGTDSYTRMQRRVETERALLVKNPHFDMKEHLDADYPVLPHKESGLVFHRGMGFTLAGGSNGVLYHGKEPSDWVVTAVNPKENTVSIRRYGSPARTESINLSSAQDIGRAITPKQLDPQAEQQEILKQLTSPDDLRYLPPSALEGRADDIQRALARAHRESYGYSPWVVVTDKGLQVRRGKDMQPKEGEQPEYLLPTPASKQQLIDAARQNYLEADASPNWRERSLATEQADALADVLERWHGRGAMLATRATFQGGTWDRPTVERRQPPAVASVEAVTISGEGESPAVAPAFWAENITDAASILRAAPPDPGSHGQRNEYEQRNFRNGVGWASDKVGSWSGADDMMKVRGLLRVAQAKRKFAPRGKAPFWDGVIAGSKRMITLLEGF